VNDPSTLTPGANDNSFVLAARLVLPLALCYALVAVPVYWYQGLLGLAAAGVAALVCALGSAAAAIAASRLSATGQNVSATLLAMMLRMALPLAFCMIIYLQGGPLADAGLVLYLLVFYMVALAADTWQALGRVKSLATGSKES